MLSKSAARAFFLGGTALCTIAFLILTVDTMGQLEARSNAGDITPEVQRGYHIYIENNCMGCHTLMGEGAYYAPELTKVVSRRGEAWIRMFLRDPQAMYPGRRKMVKYAFFDPRVDPEAEKNVGDVIAFFTWIERIDLNGFPPRPNLAMPNQPLAASAGKAAAVPPPAIFAVCKGCHALGGNGGNVGPALDGVKTRYTPEALGAWIKAPEKVKPGTAMPNLGLTDEQIAELVQFLGQQE
jgi:nitric oxide reductase subunit C